MDEDNAVHLYNGVLLSCLKQTNKQTKNQHEICRQMDRTRKKLINILSDVIQTQEGKHGVYS